MLTVRTAPVRTSPLLDRSFDRAFDQLVGSFFDQRRAPGPLVDASWQDDTYVLTVDLPGVPASAVEVQVAGRTLTLQATTPTLDWRRSVRLGGRLDPEQVTANHVDGRLTVRIGTVGAPAARQVAISTTPLATPALEAAVDEQVAEGEGDEEMLQSDDTNTAG